MSVFIPPDKILSEALDIEVSGVDPASKIRRAILVIFGSQVS